MDSQRKRQEEKKRIEKEKENTTFITPLHLLTGITETVREPLKWWEEHETFVSTSFELNREDSYT